MNPIPCDVARYLIYGVQRAAQGCSERDVVTYLTRPMWDIWNQFTGNSGDPTPWLGKELTRRVFGSETIIIPGDNLLAFSLKR